MADIIRQNQIRQIKEEDNYYKKIVMNRNKDSVKDYEENIKPPQVLDTTIVSSNKDVVKNFIEFLNTLYMRLNIIYENTAEFLSTFRNTDRGEYKKYISELNIVKPFDFWEKIINEYMNPKLNEITREGIKNNIQKLTPFLRNIIKFIEETIDNLCNVYLNEIGAITDTTMYNNVFPDNEGFTETHYERIKKLKEIDVKTLMKPHIEALALYKNLYEQIERNNLKPLSKSEIAYEIAQILNNLSVKFKNEQLKQMLMSLFDNTELPELAPYFRAGYDNFRDRFQELDSMQGYYNAEDELARPIDIYGDNDDNDDNDNDDEKIREVRIKQIMKVQKVNRRRAEQMMEEYDAYKARQLQEPDEYYDFDDNTELLRQQLVQRLAQPNIYSSTGFYPSDEESPMTLSVLPPPWMAHPATGRPRGQRNTRIIEDEERKSPSGRLEYPSDTESEYTQFSNADVDDIIAEIRGDDEELADALENRIHGDVFPVRPREARHGVNPRRQHVVPPPVPPTRGRRLTPGARPMQQQEIDEARNKGEGEGKPKNINKQLRKLIKYPSHIVNIIKKHLPKSDKDFITKLTGKGKKKLIHNKKSAMNFDDRNNEMYNDYYPSD